MNIVDTLFHASKVKRMRIHRHSTKTSSAQFKIHVGDLKDGVVMISFTECLWDDTCLPNIKFSAI
jgi:hypothetical protein